MKKNLLFVFTFFGLVLFTASCSSNYDATPTNNSNVRNPLQGSFTAVVNGEQFVADEKSFFDTTINKIRSISIAGLEFSTDRNPKRSKTITLNIPNYTGPHGYVIDGMNSAQYIISDTNGVKTYNAYAGDGMSRIDITQVSPNLEGTFQLKVILAGTNQPHDTLTVAEGTFSIPR